MEPLSQDKNAVVARAFASEGAQVSPGGRTLAKVGGVAGEVSAAGVSQALAP
jgi:hypothetical protein